MKPSAAPTASTASSSPALAAAHLLATKTTRTAGLARSRHQRSSEQQRSSVWRSRPCQQQQPHPAANQFNLVNRPNFPRENSTCVSSWLVVSAAATNPYGAGNVGGVGSSPASTTTAKRRRRPRPLLVTAAAPTAALTLPLAPTSTASTPTSRISRYPLTHTTPLAPSDTSRIAAATSAFLTLLPSTLLPVDSTLLTTRPPRCSTTAIRAEATPLVLAPATVTLRRSTSTGKQEPKIIQWNKRKSMGVDMVIGQLAQPAMGDKNAARRLSTVVHPAPNSHSFFTVIYRRVYNFFFISGDGMKTASGDARIDYLDGMRGFACLFVSLGHFILMFWNAIANFYGPTTTTASNTGLASSLVPSSSMPVLCLVSSSCSLRVPWVRATWSRVVSSPLADNSVRRMPRLIIPAAGACLANYLMIDVGAYKWVPRMNSLTWSTWAYYQNYTNAIEFVDSFIALWWASPPDNPALVTHYATGVLWTIPVIVQGAWTCMLCAVLCTRDQDAWKRFFFYFCCILLSWYAQTWDLFFMAGLVIADLDINLKYRKWGEMGIPSPPKGYAKLLRIPNAFVRSLLSRARSSLGPSFSLAVSRSGSLTSPMRPVPTLTLGTLESTRTSTTASLTSGTMTSDTCTNAHVLRLGSSS